MNGESPLSPEAKAFFAAAGRKGNARMTPQQKRERALKANAASQASKLKKKLLKGTCDG